MKIFESILVSSSRIRSVLNTFILKTTRAADKCVLLKMVICLSAYCFVAISILHNIIIIDNNVFKCCSEIYLFSIIIVKFILFINIYIMYFLCMCVVNEQTCSFSIIKKKLITRIHYKNSISNTLSIESIDIKFCERK